MQLFKEDGTPNGDEVACALVQEVDDLQGPDAELVACPARFKYLNATLELMGSPEESNGGFSGLRLFLDHRGKQIAEVSFLGIESRGAIPEILEFLSSNPDGIGSEKSLSPETLKTIATVLARGGALIKSEMGVDPEGLAEEYSNRISEGSGLAPKVRSFVNTSPENAGLSWTDLEVELPDVAPTRQSVLDFLAERCANTLPQELNMEKLKEDNSSFFDVRLFGDDPKGRKVVIGDKLAFFVGEGFVLTIHSGSSGEWEKIVTSLADQFKSGHAVKNPRDLTKQIFAKVTRANEQQINMLSEAADRLDHMMLTTRNPNLDAAAKQIAGLSDPALYCASKMMGLKSSYDRFVSEFSEASGDRQKKVEEMELRDLIHTIESKAHRTVRKLTQIREQEENLVGLRSAIAQKNTAVLAAIALPALAAIGLLDAYAATWSMTGHVITWIGAAISTVALLGHGRSRGWL